MSAWIWSGTGEKTVASSGDPAPPRLLMFALALAATVGILGVTLVPVGGSDPMSGGLCLVCGERGLANIIGNLLLFIPLGAALALGRLSAVRIILLAAFLSAGIELTQHVIPGRNPNPADTLFNTLGGVLGVGIVRSSPRWLCAEGLSRVRLGAVALAMMLAVFGATGVLASPSFPDAVYYGQWVPARERMPSYPGRVLEVRLGAMQIPSARLENGERVRSLLSAGEPLEILAVAGPTTTETWPIFRIADAMERRIVVDVARRGDDVVVRLRTRATAVRLHPPELRVTGAFTHVSSGDPVRIRVWQVEQGHCLEVAGVRTCDQGMTIGRGWAFVHGIPRLRPGGRQFLDMTWLATLLLPVGLWLRGPRHMVAGGVVVAVALLLIPARSALLPTPPLEFAACFLGLLAGASFPMRRYHGDTD
jgi:hypothetical protein